ncbi:MAG: diaminopimelate epimerase, partial [Veillonella sp.]|nr:diaminopimelate epimerase [Veillonella sp.]
MKLTKMHGLGNDFILFADPQGANKDYTDLTCDVRMRIINSDGSEAEMCGNAIRCFAKYAYEHGEITKETFTIETLAGVMKPTLTIENGIVTQVTVDMGKPFFAAQDIPMDVNMDKVIDVDLDVNGETVTVSSVLLGVPHTEVYINDITKAPVTTQGPIIE